jgi:hypothetical protein
VPTGRLTPPLVPHLPVPYPTASGPDAYVKIGLKELPRKHGIYLAKIYSFKRWT